MFWLRTLCIVTVTSLVQAQIWDLYYDDYDDEEEENSSMFGDDYYIDENATYVLVMSSAQVRSERALYNECIDIIEDEVNFLINDPEPIDTDLLNMTAVDELILESTLKLFNILQPVVSEQESKTRRISITDIYVWSNNTEDEINALLEKYYSEG